MPITAKNFATLCSGEKGEGRMPRTVNFLLPLFVHVQFHALRLFVLVLIRLLTPRFWVRKVDLPPDHSPVHAPRRCGKCLMAVGRA